MLVKELRQELAKRGLNTSGKKADLEERYKEALEKEAEANGDIVEEKKEPDTANGEEKEEEEENVEKEEAEPSNDNDATTDAPADEEMKEPEEDKEDTAKAEETNEAKEGEDETENDKTEDQTKKSEVEDGEKRESPRRSDEGKFRPLSTDRSGEGSEDKTKLYIGNLSFDAREDDLRDAFEKYGKLTDLYLPKDRYDSRKIRGFAFVTFEEEEQAKAAIDGMDGKDLVGRTITCNIARPRRQRNNFGGDRRDFRRGSHSRGRRSRSPGGYRRRNSYNRRSRSPRRYR